MAANYKAELKDVESVMQFYRLHGKNPLFVIYTGVSMNNICYDFLDKEQPEQGEENLQNFLDLLNRDLTNTNVYTIQLVDEIIEQKAKEPKYTGRALRFQLHTPQPYNAPHNTKEIIYNNIPTLPVGEGGEVTELLKQLLREQKEENQKLRELLESNIEEEEDDDDEEEDDDDAQQLPPPLTVNQRIAGIAAQMLERDEIQEAIAGLVINGQKWLSKKVFKIGENE